MQLVTIEGWNAAVLEPNPWKVRVNQHILITTERDNNLKQGWDKNYVDQNTNKWGIKISTLYKAKISFFSYQKKNTCQRDSSSQSRHTTFGRQFRVPSSRVSSLSSMFGPRARFSRRLPLKVHRFQDMKETSCNVVPPSYKIFVIKPINYILIL